MRAIFLTFIFFYSSSSLYANEPQWLTELIQKQYANKKSQVSITENKYKNKNVFVVDRTKACCDLGATVYNQNGEVACKFIGLAGAWENKCSDFSKNNKIIRFIYESI